MTDPDQLPALPESEYLLARPARPYENEYVTSFDGYSDDDMRSYALTAIVAERARADALEAALRELADAVLAIHMEGVRYGGPLTLIVRKAYDGARALLKPKGAA